MRIKVKMDDAKLKTSDGIQHSGLEKRQKVLSVVFMVLYSDSMSGCVFPINCLIFGHSVASINSYTPSLDNIAR